MLNEELKRLDGKESSLVPALSIKERAKHRKKKFTVIMWVGLLFNAIA